jgi:T-complex protein 1 subunit beta
LIYLGVAQGQASTIVLRGATQQILDEAERSIHDALCVLSQTVKEPRICYGGGLLKIWFLFTILEKFNIWLGAAEMLMATAVSQLAEKTPGKESVAIESFARALRQVIERIFSFLMNYSFIVTNNYC